MGCEVELEGRIQIVEWGRSNRGGWGEAPYNNHVTHGPTKLVSNRKSLEGVVHQTLLPSGQKYMK